MRPAAARRPFAAPWRAAPVPARYVCEPGRGIGNARNRALRESAGMDYIAFLDDDEVATPEWLAALYQTMRRCQADIVTGPVTPKFLDAPAVDRPAAASFACARRPPAAPSRSSPPIMFSSVPSLRRSYKFDSRFDATGGEDTHFFMRMRRDGLRLVWCQEAEVIETIPADRTKVRWMLRRAQSEANRYTRCCLDLDPSLAVRAPALRQGAAGMRSPACCCCLPGLLRKKYAVRGLQWIYRALGTWSALWGAQTIYYATTPALATPAATIGDHLES